jgi:hypothetical protein
MNSHATATILTANCAEAARMRGEGQPGIASCAQHLPRYFGLLQHASPRLEVANEQLVLREIGNERDAISPIEGDRVGQGTNFSPLVKAERRR